MRRRHGNRARLGAVLLAALGAMALLALPSMAAAKDRNRDRIPDRWEKRHHLSTHVNQAGRDQDRDHLNNRGEFKAGDNPRDRDTDNDGVMDGNENAGTIASYDPATGKLVITLFGGDTVSGTVTDETRIKCGHECNHHEDGDESGASASHEGHSGPGGGESSGPPGQGDDENDDPPGHDGTPPGASEGPGNGAEHGDHGANCTPDALVVGATVEEAELELRNGTATFDRIVLEQEDQDDQAQS